jgi:PAS domain S-box-containing protein
VSLERLSKLISIGFGLALAACLMTLALDEYFGEQAAQATDRRHQSITAIAQIGTLNRELTQLARLYVTTGDELFLTRYNQKWQQGRKFQEVAQDFRAMGLSDNEEQLLKAVEVMDVKQTDMERLAMRESFHRGGPSLLSGISYINSEWGFADALNQLITETSERFNNDFKVARKKAELASRINVLMQLITLGAALLAFLIILRRQLVVPLMGLSERIRRLQAGEAVGEPEQRTGLAEVVALNEAFDAYVDVNEEMRRQHWVKERLGELVQVLQMCATPQAFAATLQQWLQDCLNCHAVLSFDAVPAMQRSGEVHFSLPLLQEGQQLASLELDFTQRPDPAHFKLLDSLPARLGTLLHLVQQRLHNQQLLQQARRQAGQLEDQALILQQRQDSLEATESWYRGIVEFAPKALLVFDENGVILANQQSEATFGYAPGGLLGQNCQVLLPESQRELVASMVEQLRREKVLDPVEVIGRRSDGSEFPVELRLCLLPARQGYRESLCIAIRDLTQRNADERRLREAHEQQQAIVTAAPCGIALVQGGVIVQANLRLDELFGFAPGEQLQCSPVNWLDPVVWAETKVALEAQVRATLNSGEIYHQDLQLCRKDSTSFWASLSARAIAPGDLSRGSIWIVEDISAQQAAAAEMQQAQQLAEESARIKAEFLANMSHEIRTPMNAIIGMTHLTLRTELNERQRDYLSKVQSSSRHLLGVLDDVLDFSKIEAGKLQLDVCNFSLTKLLEEVVDQVRPRIADKRLDLHLNTGADVPECLCGDPLRLRQVLLNFLSNAVKFTERGQIRIEVNLRQASQDDVLLYFSVTDTGIGLSAEQLEVLFQSFQQADASITRRFGGTGLGLAIAKQLAELMGGQVGVQSELGAGSTFWFEVRLQLAQDDVIDNLSLAPYRSDWKVAHGTRILLVEDNELNQQVAAELLRAVGCCVDIASDGREALERLAAEEYDLVFMDMQMPVLDGLAATRQLRQRPGLSALPVIAITANARRSDHDACLAAGMNDFVSKPFEPHALYAMLQRWLSDAPISHGGAHTLKPTPVAHVTNAKFNLDGVDTEAGMRRVLGNQPLYLDLLRNYLADQSLLLEQLNVTLATGDLERAELLAHSCKGVSATVGADTVAQAAHALEQALRIRQPAEMLQVCLERLSQPLSSLLGQLHEQLPPKVESPSMRVDLHRLNEVCHTLDTLLGESDGDAVHYFSRHTALLRGAFASGFAPLEDAVKRFSFEQAQSRLNEALQACATAAASE